MEMESRMYISPVEDTRMLPESNNYQDRLYINDGKGNFKLDSLRIATKFYQQTLCKSF